jgi:DNA-binding MarR family transcriptional regulator
MYVPTAMRNSLMQESAPAASPAKTPVIGEVPFAVELHLSLIRAYERLIQANTQNVARWGLTPQQYNAIRIIYFGGPGGMRLTDVGERLLQRVPDVSRLVDRLERADLARRRPDPEDGRAVLVELTAGGRRLLEEMDADHMDAHERWYSGLTPIEQRRLASLLRKVTASLDPSVEE